LLGFLVAFKYLMVYTEVVKTEINVNAKMQGGKLR